MNVIRMNRMDRNELIRRMQDRMDKMNGQNEVIGTNDKGKSRYGKWRKSNMSWWIKGIMKEYEGPNDMVMEKMRGQ